jgi:uncharacterized membrane protein YbhN (UPF0104 family)
VESAVTRRVFHRATIALQVVGAIVAAVVLFRFPWHLTIATLIAADPKLLLAALAVNLVSLVAKGWAWHLLLLLLAPSRWVAAQEANLIGCAANSVSVTVVGEIARVNRIVARDRVPLQSAMVSVVWARAVEALGLAIFMLVAPSVLRLPPILHGLQVASGAVLLGLLVAAWTGRVVGVARLFPSSARSALARVVSIGSPRRLALPTLMALVNWGAQWVTYHLTLLALHVPTGLAGSFTALVVCNLSGLARATPGNVGIAQGAMALALLPFGVSPQAAVAAGLALQGIQVLPVLALAIGAVGWKGLTARSDAVKSPA